MFTFAVPAWEIVVRSIVVYGALLLALRLAGKRQIGQLNLFDLVVLLLIANAVQNAMVGPDNSLGAGLLAAGTLLAVNAAVALLRWRWRGLRSLVEGTPTVLVMHGHPIETNLRREGIDQETLEAALREHGFANLDDVDMAVLEIDGAISIVPAAQPAKRVRHRTRFLERH